MADNKRGIKAIFEDMLNLRIKKSEPTIAQLPIAKPGDSLGDILYGLESSNLLDISQFNEFRMIASDREAQYRIYDEMCLDSIIASAIELYADDATQYNSKGEVIWAESENQDVSAFANRMIEVLDLNKNAWSHIYSLVKYGDVYLETFRDEETDNDDPLMKRDLKYTDTKVGFHKIGSKMDEYVEMVRNPAQMFDLTKRGKTVGFIKVEMDDDKLDALEPRYSYQHIQQGQETIVMPPDKYVHIALATGTERFPETLSISFNKDGEKDTQTTYQYTINRGKSILHDLYKIYKEVSLMEDSLLLNRVTRSSIIRMLQVEVGDMPKAQSRELLKRVKQLVEQKNYMDKNTGYYTSLASPGPIDNVIYIPTHDGKGQISMSNLGGDVDVKSIADIDYFKNKLYGGLKIPKQFLGDTDDAAGFSGGTSLTKLDSRYARTIKRIQNAYIEGVTTLINLFAISKGLDDHVNNFTVKMLSPSTIEDQERDETLDNRMNMAGTFMGLVGDEDMTNPLTRKKMLLYFINHYMNEPELADLLNNDDTAKKATEELNDNDNEDFEGDGFEGGDFDTDFGGDNGPSGGGEGDLEPMTPDDLGNESSEEEGPEEIDFDSGSQDEFGSFEQEF